MYKFYLRIVVVNHLAAMFQIYVIAALIFCVTAKSSVRPFLAPRIIKGGRNATIEEHPYMISLQYDGEHKCGGTLIKPNVVVTAAHCVIPFEHNLKSLTVRAGSTQRETGGKVVNIIRYCVHPKYININGDYDVSVLILDYNFIKTPELPTETVPLQPANTNMSTGTIGTISGWGELSPYGSLPEVLQALDIHKFTQEDCQKTYLRRRLNITDRMICFGTGVDGEDSCMGDSGGPLIVDGQLAGIISKGPANCGLARYPMILGKVANEEINNFILQCSEEDNH